MHTHEKLKKLILFWSVLWIYYIMLHTSPKSSK